MSNGPATRVPSRDLPWVHILIECCLQRYMTQKEVMETLFVQESIEPCITKSVWQKMEEENQEFFKAYYLKLTVKSQIMEFNKLLDQQLELMGQINSSIPSIFTPKRSHANPLHQNPQWYTPKLTFPDVNHAADSSLQSAFNNGGPSLHPSAQSTVDKSVQASRVDLLSATVPMRSSTMNLMQGSNGRLLNSQTWYSDASQYMVSPDGNVLEPRPLIDAKLPSFRSVESDSQALHEPFLDSDVSELGTLSFSDLAVDFNPSSGFLPS